MNDWLIGFSHKLISKIQLVVTRKEKPIRKNTINSSSSTSYHIYPEKSEFRDSIPVGSDIDEQKSLTKTTMRNRQRHRYVVFHRLRHCGLPTASSKPVRARLLWAIFSSVLPVNFEDVSTCRNATLALLAAIHFVVKLSAACFGGPKPFPLVLGCDRPLVGIETENSEVIQETPHKLLFLPPHEFPELHELRQSPVLHMLATNPVKRIRLLHSIASMLQ